MKRGGSKKGGKTKIETPFRSGIASMGRGRKKTAGGSKR